MFLEKTNRRIVPRWRDFLTTCAIGELDATGGRVQGVLPYAEIPQETRAAWQANKTLWHALDLVGVAFVVGELRDQQVLEAAEFISAHEASCPRAGIDLARRIINPGEQLLSAGEVEEEVESPRSQIHVLRRRLVDEPRNSILWVDLARLYTVAGSLRKAADAIAVSRSLGADNRFILRSAARFYVHTGQKDLALKLIRKSPLVTTDPWLTAAEIGISSFVDTSPHHVRTAREMLEDDNLSAFSKTELASALGTLELLDGRQRIAKKLFRQSLTSPTENSLAQAEWASGSIGELGVDFDVAQAQVPRSYEARALHGMTNGDWLPSVENAVKWLKDQPFSSRPAAVASYLWSVIFEKHDRAEAILKSALVSSPEDRTLVNNLAFALASQNRTAEAEEILKAAGPDIEDLAGVTLLATRGLLMFRKGQYEEGRDFYLHAIDRARFMSQAKYESMAMLYLAREEILADLPTKDETLARARKLALKQGDPDVLLVLDRTTDMKRAAKKKP